MTPRTQLMAVAVVLALAGVVDFFQRVHVPRAPASRHLDPGSPALPAAPLSLADARQRLQSWFPVAAPEAETPSADANSGPADAADLPPDRGDIAGWRFVLRGVFDAGRAFAVFDVMSSAGGAVEQHRLSAGEAVNGVRVQRISGRAVTLSDAKTTIHLVLFTDPENDMARANEKDQ